MATPKDPHGQARRLARLIISDIILYNQDKIEEGIKNDSLFEVLAEDLGIGRKYYEKNIDPTVARETNYFDLAIVDLLIKKGAQTPSKIW